MYPGSRFRMADALLETFVKQYIESQQVPEVTFAWQGGEPTLMGLDFFERVIHYQQKHARPGMTIHNALLELLLRATHAQRHGCQMCVPKCFTTRLRKVYQDVPAAVSL